MWDLKCTPGSIVQIPEPGRGIHITSGCDNQHGFCMSGRETGTSVRNYLFLSLLKTQALILTEGGQIRAKWSLWRQTGLCGYSESTTRTDTSVPVPTHSPTPPMHTILPGSSNPFYMASDWGNAIAPPSQILGPALPNLHPSRSLLLKIVVSIFLKKCWRWVSDWVVWLWGWAISPHLAMPQQ